MTRTDGLVKDAAEPPMFKPSPIPSPYFFFIAFFCALGWSILIVAAKEGNSLRTIEFNRSITWRSITIAIVDTSLVFTIDGIGAPPYSSVGQSGDMLVRKKK